ncbi:MAG: hypothetical protein DHS20C15_12480 [Planctomycetota bacterium]|nr:MAG: hypothetical protein DHS20C15_12480 [Planctomycetota bacterium]
MTARALVSLGVLLLAAVGAFELDARLDAREAERTHTSLRVAPLIAPDVLEDLSVAALRVQVGSEAQHFYARVQGVWRCTSWRNALAGESAVSALVDGLTSAAGTLDPLPAEQVADWGFDTDDTLLLSLHGPAARLDSPTLDVQFRVEIGNSVPAVGGCFARFPGADEVFALDVDLRAMLRTHHDDAESTAPEIDDEELAAALPFLLDPSKRTASVRGDFPPLLDPTLLGASNLPRGARFTEMLIVRPGSPPVRLLEQPSGATEDDLRRGASPFIHVLISGEGQPQYTVAPLIASFMIFLQTARWEEQLDARRAGEFGISNESPRVALKRDDGFAFALVLGTPTNDGLLPVFNTASGQLALVGLDVAAALQPSALDFLPAAPRNLWDAWLEN